MLRLALLGCGRIARLVHLPRLLSLAGASVVAIADSSPPALEDAGRVAPSARRFADWREAIAAGGADACVVALPPALHAEAAVAAFRAGLHAYVEKPLATTADDARAAVAAWRASGRVGQVGLNFRHDDRFLRLRERLREGALGVPLALVGRFASARRELPAWKRVRGGGGSALHDLGAHHLDLVEFLLGEPIVAVAAHERDVDARGDVAQVLVRTRAGVPATLTLATSSGAGGQAVELWASGGHVLVDVAEPALHAPWSVARGRGPRLAAALAGLAPARWARPVDPERSFDAALRAFAGAIAANGPATPDLAVGLRALDLALAAERAAIAGAWVDVPPPAAGAG